MMLSPEMIFSTDHVITSLGEKQFVPTFQNIFSTRKFYSFNISKCSFTDQTWVLIYVRKFSSFPKEPKEIMMILVHSIDSSWSFSFFYYLRFKIYQLISNFEYFFVLVFKSHHFTKKTGHYKYLYWILRKITADDFMSSHHLKIKISRQSNLGIQIYP